MLTTQIFAHTIEVHFNIFNNQEEKIYFIDEEIIENQIENGITEAQSIEVIDPNTGKNIGLCSWNIRRSELCHLEEDECNISLLGHEVSYRFADREEVELGDSGIEQIENWIREGNYQGEVIVTDPIDKEFECRGWWKTR